MTEILVPDGSRPVGPRGSRRDEMVETPFQDFPKPVGRSYKRAEIDAWRRKWEKKIQACFLTSNTLKARARDIQAVVKDLESKMETVREQRQEAQTAFQNHEQRDRQFLNMVTSVVKSAKEMQSTIIRNML